MITINFKENDRSFRGKVNKSVSDILNATLRRKKAAIVREIRALIPGWIISQPEMQSLKAYNEPYSLAAQFGLPFGTGQDAVDAIAKAVTDSFSIDISKISQKDLSGGLRLNFMPATFKDLLDLPEGKVIDEDNELHWLSWLLTEGFKVIVIGYSFRFDPGEGRSKGGYMRNGGIWRVPPQFAGTPEDNFITRALRAPQNEAQIQKVIQRNIT